MNPQISSRQPIRHAPSLLRPTASTDASKIDNLRPPSAQKTTSYAATSTAKASAWFGFPRTRGWIGAIAAATLLGLMIFRGSANPESPSPHWGHVQEATQSGHALKWVELTGASLIADSLAFSPEDEDLGTTVAVRQAILEGNLLKAEQIYSQAQSLPNLSTSTASLLPQPEPQKLTPELQQSLFRDEVTFYHLHLSDSCFNDGDVVEVLVNGAPTFTVPITNAGASLSIPVTKDGATVIAVRGLYDGGGGITVACRTSRGTGFLRSMAPGEIQPLGVALP